MFLIDIQDRMKEYKILGNGFSDIQDTLPRYGLPHRFKQLFHIYKDTFFISYRQIISVF